MKRSIMAVAVLVAACAKSPESIAPTYVSTHSYESWTCEQLSLETIRVEQALVVAGEQQTQARGNDVVGVILIGFPVSTLSGDNIAVQVGNLKGQKQAIENTMTLKNCGKVR